MTRPHPPGALVRHLGHWIPWILPQLSSSQLDSLNAPITEQEITIAFLLLPNNKTPSPNSFSTKYYKKFSPILILHLKLTFNAAVSSGPYVISKYHNATETREGAYISPKLPPNFLTEYGFKSIHENYGTNAPNSTNCTNISDYYQQSILLKNLFMKEGYDPAN